MDSIKKIKIRIIKLRQWEIKFKNFLKKYKLLGDK